MKKMIISVIFSIVFMSSASAQSGKIIVEVSGIDKMEGQLAVGLFDKADGFPEMSVALKGVFLEMTDNNIQHVFFDIPAGDYAVAVFHDVNRNNELDKNFLGIPKEGYGFSKNAEGTFGPPHFDDAKFKLGGTYTAKIKMDYRE